MQRKEISDDEQSIGSNRVRYSDSMFSVEVFDHAAGVESRGR